MPVTLAEAQRRTGNDIDFQVIDEFRKQSAILDTMIFHDAVHPVAGATLTFNYHRLKTERGAAFRAFNAEYSREKVATERFDVDLKPLGGIFGIDRVLARIGGGAQVQLELEQVIKSTRTKFTDELINGDTAVDSDGFDGLDKALTGSTTEIQASDIAGGGDWSDLDGSNAVAYQAALDGLDEFWSLLDGPPSVTMGHSRMIAKLRAIARRANQYVQRPVEGLTDGVGAPVVREYFGNSLLVDAGEKAGSNDPIIPLQARKSDLYCYRIGMDGFHGVSMAGAPLLQTWLPDFDTAGAVKDGEVEMGPVAVVLRATKAAAVLRDVQLTAAGS